MLNRNTLVRIARDAAYEHRSEHDYLPQDLIAGWHPHDWVVTAMENAIEQQQEAFDERMEEVNEKLADAAHDVRMLAALDAAGVDNWDGYGEALNILDEGSI